jgi:hypothetical protein
LLVPLCIVIASILQFLFNMLLPFFAGLVLVQHLWRQGQQQLQLGRSTALLVCICQAWA